MAVLKNESVGEIKVDINESNVNNYNYHRSEINTEKIKQDSSEITTLDFSELSSENTNIESDSRNSDYDIRSIFKIIDYIDKLNEEINNLNPNSPKYRELVKERDNLINKKDNMCNGSEVEQYRIEEYKKVKNDFFVYNNYVVNLRRQIVKCKEEIDNLEKELLSANEHEKKIIKQKIVYIESKMDDYNHIISNYSGVLLYLMNEKNRLSNESSDDYTLDEYKSMQNEKLKNDIVDLESKMKACMNSVEVYQKEIESLKEKMLTSNEQEKQRLSERIESCEKRLDEIKNMYLNYSGVLLYLTEEEKKFVN